MTIPTEDQVYERWDELPMTLREALTSDANSALIRKISEAEHIPDEKIHEIGRAVSNVLLGFIHPEDVPAELKLSGLNPKSVSSLVDSINKTIFAPLRADIDKVYQPISKLQTPVKVFQDIGQATTAKPGSAATPSTPAPVSINKISPAQTPTTQGWSTSKPIASAPATTVSSTTPGVVTIKPTTPQQVPPQAPKTGPSASAPVPFPKPMTKLVAENATGKFTSMPQPINQPAPFAPIPPAVPKAPTTPEPAPMMLHEDLKPQSLQKSSDFRLSRPGEKGGVDMSAPMSKGPTQPAVLELGKNPAPNPVAKPPAGVSKAVHYTQFQNSGPRNISEVTAPAPTAPMAAPTIPATPAMPPRPPAMPKPPTPSPYSSSPSSVPQVPKPPSPGDKPIVKNY